MKPIGHGFFAETKQKRKHAEAVKKYWKKERGKIILSKAARKYYRNDCLSHMSVDRKIDRFCSIDSIVFFL